jgi:hypothetical protein
MTIGLERTLNRYIDGYYNANSRCCMYPQDTDDNYIAYLSIKTKLITEMKIFH